MTARFPLIAGALLGGLAVALGAFGAHWLRGAVAEWGLESTEQIRRMEVWEIAVRYQMYHALALLLVGGLTERNPSPGLWKFIAWMFIIGVAIFSGCLYALAFTGVKVLGAIVPIGGAAFLVGWGTMLVAVFRGRHAPP